MIHWALAEVIRSRGINCVIDVGGNRGQTARRMRSLGYTGRIVSFEPSPTVLPVISAAAARDPDWIVRPVALSSQPGKAELRLHKGPELDSLLDALPGVVEQIPIMEETGTATITLSTLADEFRADHHGDRRAAGAAQVGHARPRGGGAPRRGRRRDSTRRWWPCSSNWRPSRSTRPARDDHGDGPDHDRRVQRQSPSSRGSSPLTGCGWSNSTRCSCARQTPSRTGRMGPGPEPRRARGKGRRDPATCDVRRSVRRIAVDAGTAFPCAKGRRQRGVNRSGRSACRRRSPAVTLADVYPAFADRGVAQPQVADVGQGNRNRQGDQDEDRGAGQRPGVPELPREHSARGRSRGASRPGKRASRKQRRGPGPPAGPPAARRFPIPG